MPATKDKKDKDKDDKKGKEDKEEKVCLNCKPSLVKMMSGKDVPFQEVHESSDEVPEWSKKNGNYSPLPRMVSCEERYNVAHAKTMKPEEPELGECPIKVTLEDLPDDVWVFFWAATSSEDPLKIIGPIKAYDDEVNHGLQKTDENGKVTLSLNCPQPYKVDKKTYARHIHYIVENPKEKVWSTMKTIRFVSPISRTGLEEAIQEKTALVIFSLPEEYYDKDHIKGTLNLPREDLDNLPKDKKVGKVQTFIKEHIKDNPHLQKIHWRDVPIVTYCMNETCKSSGRLLEHLYECGVNNVREYGPGMKGWRSKVSPIDTEDTEDLFSDAAENEDENEDEDEDENEEERADEPDEPEKDTEESVEATEEATEETGEKDTDDSSERDTMDVIYQGVEYILETTTKDGTLSYRLLNDDHEDMGIPKIKGKDKVMSVAWSSDEARVDHTKNHISDSEAGEDEDEDEDEEVEDEVEEEVEEEDEEEDQGYMESAPVLQQHKVATLKEYVKEMHERRQGSYAYSGKKTDDELKEFIGICQQASKKSKKYLYWKTEDLESKSTKELKYIVKQMSHREPDTFNKGLNLRKPDLVKYILTCRGSSRTSTSSKMGRGQTGGHRGYGSVNTAWGYSV